MDNFQFSSNEFYDEVEKELAARQAPGLKISRVDFYQGGVMSDKRTYLRLSRERYAFDVCAAPFGREFFFSLRFIERPRPGLLALLAILAALALIALVVRMIGPGWAVGIFFALIVATCYKLVTSAEANKDKVPTNPENKLPASQPEFEFDDLLFNLPFIGEWIEGLRKETYYRYDTRMMYHTLVSEIVKKKVEEVTASKGVKLIRSYEYSPILGELYKSSEVKTNKAEAA